MKTFIKLLTVTALISIIGFPARADLTSGTEGGVLDSVTKSSAKISSEKSAAGVHTPRNTIEPRSFAAADIHAPAANTAAVVTYAAVAAKKHVISGITVSYAGSGTLSGGNVKIEDVSGTVVFTADIDAKGVYTFPFYVPKRSAAVNTALIVTLAAGGSNVTGKVSVLSHWTE